MRRGLAWAWAAAATLALAAGTASANGKGTLTGFVENEKSKPVAGAEIVVEVPGKPPIKGVTDANGKFTIPNVPVGSVKVRILAKGCYPWEENVVIAGKGSTSTAATLRLGVRLAGKVTDARGAPIEGVRVRAVRQRKDTDRITWNDVLGESGTRTVRTAADGTFQIDGLPPARRWSLTLRHHRHKAAEVGDLPGKAGAVKEGIAVTMDDAAWVSGVVVDAAGKPVAKARIGGGPDSPPIQVPESEQSAERESWFELYDDWNVSDAQGKFVLGGITDGDVEVVVDADGYFVAKAKVEGLAAGKEIPDVKVTLEPANAFLEGWVVDKAGKPIPHAYVRLEAEDGESAARGSASENGMFKFPHVRSRGPVTLIASASEYSEKRMEKVALNKKGMKVSLLPAPKIALKVLDADGRPVPSLWITVKTNTGAAGRGESSSSQSYPQRGEGVVVYADVGEVSLEIRDDDEEYETATAGPWKMTAGQNLDGGTVTLKKKKP